MFGGLGLFSLFFFSFYYFSFQWQPLEAAQQFGMLEYLLGSWISVQVMQS